MVVACLAELLGMMRDDVAVNWLVLKKGSYVPGPAIVVRFQDRVGIVVRPL